MVTFATSHWLRSPLKVEAWTNTVAKTRRPITCTVNAQNKKGRRKNPRIKQYCDSPKKAKDSLNDRHSRHQPKQPPPPSEPPCITRCICSGHVTSSSNIRTSVSTWWHACWWHASDYFHTNPSVSQRTRTFAPTTTTNYAAKSIQFYKKNS